MDPYKIGKFILALRKENNLTQAAFAEMLGVTFQAVSKWETGKNIPDILIIKEICQKFDVDINEILDGNRQLKKKRKKIYIVSGFSFLIILVFGLIWVNRDSGFEFKTLSSDCDDFNIYGNVAYNNNKSYIYISKIEYCGGDDPTEYAKIECILAEADGDTQKNIASYVSDQPMKLEDFLKNMTFHVDDYEAVCKNFSGSNIFLQIYATDALNKVTSYKVSLNSQNTCNDH